MSIELCPNCLQPLEEGAWPFCDDGSGRHGHSRPRGGSLLTAIHTSERSVIYRNPRTGEIRYPARNDQPVPPVYAKQGYERQELTNSAEIKSFERASGRLHEATHWYKNSPEPERALTDTPTPSKPDLALRHRLAEALR